VLLTTSDIGSRWVASSSLCLVLWMVAGMGCSRQSADVADAMPRETTDGQPQQISWDVRFAIEENGRRRAHLLADRMEHYETEDSSYVLFTMIPDSAATDSTDADVEPEAKEAADTGPERLRREETRLEEIGPENTETEDPSRRRGASSSKRIDPERATAYIFEEGDSSAVIIAERMMYFADEGRFEAFGNVDVQTVGGKQLATEHLTWKQSSRKIQTRRFVRITTPTEDVQGNGLVADEDLDTYQIGRFTARVDVDEDDDSPAPDDESETDDESEP